MKKRITSCILIICVALTIFSASPIIVGAAEAEIWDGTVASGFESGSGTEADPYVIKTPQQLAYLASQVNSGTTYESEYLVLANDIKLNDTTNWESWGTSAPANIWTAIGNASKISFEGSFDGKGYTISGIYINNELDYQGLFGHARGGTVQNLGVTDSYIHGKSCVGGVVGYNYGKVSNCYNAGTVSGTEKVGGVAGHAYGTIINCYNIGGVSGTKYVGGFVGVKSSKVINCYYLTGCATDGNNTIQYGVGNYTIGSTTADVVGTTVGLTDEEMKQQESFVGFDFQNFWAIVPQTGYDYPQFIMSLHKSYGEDSAIWDGTVASDFESGSGTEADPYVIKTSQQLAYLASQVNSGTTYEGEHFILANDIKLNDNTKKYWILNASPWLPIGTSYLNPFKGSFDGKGYTVSGIYINNELNCQGLFGYVRGSTIQNLGVTASYIHGKSNIGGIVGCNYGKVINCYNAGTVSGIDEVGGITGFNGDTNTIENCYNTGTVRGESNVGGIAGWNYYNSQVAYCYNTGEVSGVSSIGGVVGMNYGITISCYNASRVSGGSRIGGVVGYNLECISVFDCYNTGEVSGTDKYVGGIVGFNKGGSTIENCYNAGRVSGKYYVGGVAGTTYESTIINCYYLISCATDGNNTIQYGIGKYTIGSTTADVEGEVKGLTDEEMKQQESFVGFDFQNVWSMNPSSGYYYPQLIMNFGEDDAENSAIWDGTVASDFESGSGTEADPYVIKTPQQLAYLASQVNSGTTYSKKYLVLADDIVLNDTTNWKRWNVAAPANTWTAIGSTFAFKGNFDGKGYTISGIYINNESEDQGLFGYVRGGTIQNLGVTASYIHGLNAVGGIVGYNEDITISNCYNTGTVSGRGQVGGVAGYNYYDGIVENCYNTGTVKALTSGGGVVGGNKSTISNCYNTGSVSSSGVFDSSGDITSFGYAGGIVGYNADATVINCYNTGTVSNIFDAGGIVGNNDNSTVSSCYNTGTIKGMRVEDNYGDKVGGIIGSNVSGIVSDCYNAGKISGGYWVGGVVGINNGKLSTCYNVGTVSGTEEVGSGVGRLKANGKVSSCYYLTGSAEFGISTFVSGSEGDFEELTDEEMGQQDSFVGFDFQDVWTMKPSTGYNYPQLTMTLDISDEEDSVIWDGLIASGFESGSGTQSNPYVIKTPNQLAYLSEQSSFGVTYSGKYFVLANDIVLNDTTNWENWGTTAPANTWTPIGSGSGFGGNFDGKGYTVSGVYINNDTYYQGLFGYAYNGTIQNLGVTASYIQGTSCIGGIVGRNNSIVTNCYNTGKVRGSENVGGVVGYTYNTISNCYNTGEISSSGSGGGIVGCNDGAVSSCYNTGKVKGSDYSGGIAGWNYSATIANCYNTGSISGGYVGGITGFNNSASTVSNCYSTGGFSGTKTIRPVVGDNDGVLKNCYYLGSYSYPDTDGISLTDGEMKLQSSFAGFDFSTVWTIDNATNNGYPYLQALPIFVMLSRDYVTLNNATNTASFAFNVIHSGEPTGVLIVTLRDKDNRLIGLKIINIETSATYINGDDLKYTGVPYTYKAFFWRNLNDLTPLCESVGELL